MFDVPITIIDCHLCFVFFIIFLKFRVRSLSSGETS